MIAYGPVPSRRLGRSLGINNIPPKVCSYSCLYCQVGRTKKLRINRTEFYSPERLIKEVREKVRKVQENGEHIDYLSFVPDGEPTLDIHLGEEIQSLKRLGIKIAVITNGSLLWHKEVRRELLNADWVSIKVDTLDEKVWHNLNRPQRKLKLATIQEGIISFAGEFKNKLVSETMLVKGINDSESQLRELANFLINVKPAKTYLSIPTRPPTEKWIKPPEGNTLLQAYEILRKKISIVELLIDYEGDSFTVTGNSESDLLSITAVHPMQERAVKAFLDRAGDDWTLINRLKKERKLQEIIYNGKKFYLKKLKE
jgi:wyosine [tRNA(Phe)-imidazoG37] synthetase (radical SAM superfamily)